MNSMFEFDPDLTRNTSTTTSRLEFDPDPKPERPEEPERYEESEESENADFADYFSKRRPLIFPDGGRIFFRVGASR